MLKCTLTTPMSSLGWLQFRRQQICSLSPTRDKSGRVRSLATDQNQTRICAQSKLRSSLCLAKNKAEGIVLLLCTLVERLLASKSTSANFGDCEVLGIYVSAGGSKCSVVIADWLVCIADASGLEIDGDVFMAVEFCGCFSFLCFSVVLVSRLRVI